MADFAVTVPGADLVVNAKGEAATTVTITNTSGRPTRARLKVVATEPARAEWFTVRGDAFLDLPLGATQQREVHLTTPPRAPQGTHTVRYDVIPEDRPDAAVPGPAQSFTVGPPRRRPFPWWIVAVGVAVVALAIAIVVLWPNPKPKPPSVKLKNQITLSGQVGMSAVISNVGGATSFPISQTRTLEAAGQSATLLTFQECFMNSVVAKVTVVVTTAVLGQTANVSGTAQLSQQPGCNPGAVDSERQFFFDVPPGATIAKDIGVPNDTGGPGRADIHLIVTNTVTGG